MRAAGSRLTVLLALAVAALAMAGAGAFLMARESGSADTPGLPEASAQQHTALADGVVSREEYEAAVAAYAECGRAAGYTPVVLPGEGLRVTRISFQIPDPSGSGDPAVVARAQAILAGCHAQHLSLVTAAWAEQAPPHPDVTVLNSMLSTCMSGTQTSTAPAAKSAMLFGNYGEDSPAITISRDQVFQYEACALAIEAETGWLSPAPLVLSG